MLDEFAAARSEAAARPLVERVAWFVTPQLAMSYRLKPLRERLPLATFALVEHAIANQHLSEYGGLGEHALLVSLALAQPVLAGKLPAVYALAARVSTANHEYHLDLARAALRLGDRSAAIGHMSRAVHYAGRYWGLAKSARGVNQLHAHPELAPLRGDPAFEQLFADAAAARDAARAAEAAAGAKTKHRPARPKRA